MAGRDKEGRGEGGTGREGREGWLAGARRVGARGGRDWERGVGGLAFLKLRISKLHFLQKQICNFIKFKFKKGKSKVATVFN